jgi:WD40 repeat protein/tRNA A-37 threonylcarbamoyl transferase component Bud32
MMVLNQTNASNLPDPWIGRAVGDSDRYRLEERLGGGGMGDVFLATDTRLGKPVALKVLRESLAIAVDLDLKERFERECAICAALKSAHIVQVSDYGVISEGYPFYVMEYLQGQTLESILATQSKLSVERTCNIISQVCSGLQLAHEGVVIWDRHTNSKERIKVVHRDLKPANIFLVPTALGELAKVIDFGIAKIHSLKAEYSSSTNMLLGTCRYAPPEQFDVRQGQKIDERADIYSLGVILYEMLTGTDPFALTSQMKRVSNDAWLSAHAFKQPIPLRSQPGCESLSPHLEAVVMRCLEKTLDVRFPSVAALNQALQDVISPSVVSLRVSDNDAATLISTPDDNTVVDDSRVAASLPSTQITRRLPRMVMGGGAVLALAIAASFMPQWSHSPLTQFAPLAKLVNSNSQLALAETLTGNSKAVWAAVITPDGQTLLSAGEDQNVAGLAYPIKVWDVNTKQVSRILEGHRKPIQSLSLSGDGSILASGSLDNSIKIWDVKTGQLLKTLAGHTAPVWSVALSLDGQTLVSGSADRTIRIWDLRTGGSRVLAEHADVVYSVALSPDGKTIASGSADKTIKFWDLATGELIRTLGEPGGHRDAVRAVTFNRDGTQLASAGWDGFVKLWDAKTGHLLQTFQGHSDRVVAVTFLGQDTLASASLDTTIKVWDTQKGQLLQNIPAHSNWVLSVASDPDHHSLISSSSDTTIKIWR